MKQIDHAVSAAGWHQLRIIQQGCEIRALYDNAMLFRVCDNTFSNGRIGLWTKADAVTYFDDLEIRPSSKPSMASLPHHPPQAPSTASPSAGHAPGRKFFVWTDHDITGDQLRILLVTWATWTLGAMDTMIYSLVLTPALQDLLQADDAGETEESSSRPFWRDGP